MLAVLAIVSGGKIATALLVMGIPLLDMIWVVIQRLISGQSPFSGDRKHLHFKLTEIGFSEPQAVMLLYALTGIFGVSALFLQSRGKLIALIILILVMLAIIASVYSAFKGREISNDK
jgi:UDP-N-acetylmuramyl pentapeptide phosphotransferase/UDP-N-acetylglucosamine-1-phosphate transferase